ncbi:hypothetical protein [Streptomyces sp. WAC07149]|uniref:hypothetical protein n=1 Tax=Streptomyces sp. WAC07149 TaxID=2487425 RepID=UPI00163C3E55|nr:hypothetical protein [Streptomyces sp. WAC07149]
MPPWPAAVGPARLALLTRSPHDRSALPRAPQPPGSPTLAGRPLLRGQGAFGGGAPLPARGQSGGPQARPAGGPGGPGGFPQQGGAQGGFAPQGNGFERPQQPQGQGQGQQPQQGRPQQQPGAPVKRGRPQLPARDGGASRPELPGAGGPAAPVPAPAPAPAPAPQGTSWGAAAQGGHEVPRGHDELSGPGSTAEFARPDFNAPYPQGGSTPLGGSTGQFERPQPTGPLDPSSTGQFARPGGPGVGGYAEQQQAQQPGGYAPAPAPRAEAPRLPQAYQPEALPPAPAQPLDSHWSHQGGQQSAGHAPAVPQQPHQPQQAAPLAPAPQQQPLPQRGQELPAEPAAAVTGSTPTVSWKASPNDELMRQAERVRQPAAGGITTSGLPRRVPRANLVAGTAQQQSDTQAGPQVSRAPDDVRGRLTNLRRGIQQGRQAGTTGPATGSYHIDPTYQQER